MTDPVADTDPAPPPRSEMPTAPDGSTLRLGSSGPVVAAWQHFLLGQGYELGACDAEFGRRTDDATRRYQAAHGLTADGVAGPRTQAVAVVDGWGVHEAPPPPLTTLAPLPLSVRRQMFGAFGYTSAPMAGNPEAIRILDGWQSENIETVRVPDLAHAAGLPSGKVLLHRLAVEPFKALLSAWGDAGLLPRVLTFDGAWAPRFIRGSRTVLSNHAWGTAFDINARWNPLGARPTPVGSPGSVLGLVDIAHEYGWFWGGHFRTRADGMHFELARVPMPEVVG